MAKKTFNSTKKTKILTHVCSDCLNDFNSKEIFLTLAPTEDHRILYCKKCLDKLEIKKYYTYSGVLVDDEVKPLIKKRKPIVKKTVARKSIKK